MPVCSASTSAGNDCSLETAAFVVGPTDNVPAPPGFCDIVAHNLNLLIGADPDHAVTCEAATYYYNQNPNYILGASGNCTAVVEGLGNLIRSSAYGRTLWNQAPLACSPVYNGSNLEPIPAISNDNIGGYVVALNSILRPTRCHENVCLQDVPPTKGEAMTMAVCSSMCGPRYECQDSQCVQVPFNKTEGAQVDLDGCESSCNRFACQADDSGQPTCEPVAYNASQNNMADCQTGCQSYGCVNGACVPIGYQQGSGFNQTTCESICN